ncbi:MAG TPA: hypothetical protein VFH61_17820 [Thermoleophilia bacterium]|nr:hypothetical protein [Thermoleophilia bacterium]
MVTTVTTTAGSSGRAYSTIQAAWDAIDGTLVASDDLITWDTRVRIVCYNDSDFAERVFTFGATTDATRNVSVYSAAGEQFTNTSGNPSGTGVRILPTSGTGHTWTNWQEFLFLEGLEIAVYSGGGSSDECVRVGRDVADAEGTRISKCLIVGSTSLGDGDGFYAGNYSVGSASNPIGIENCLITDCGRAGLHAQIYSGGGTLAHYWNVINCTIANCTDYGIGYRTDISGQTIDFIIVNSIIGDCGTDFGVSSEHSGTLTTTGSANNFDEDSAIPGAGSPNPITFTASASPGAGDWAIFEDLTYPVGDLALQDDADNDVQGGGVGPSSNANVPTEDVYGTVRAGTTCDPGAFEVAAAPAGGRTYCFVVS